MKKLLQAYGLETVSEYFQMILVSIINGNHTQAKDQFKAMPKKERLDFITDPEIRLTERQREGFKMLILEFK
jgi:hypothetical protein